MQVRLQFYLNIGLYFSDKALEKSNSLYKNDQSSLVKYIEEYNKKLVNQKERQIMCKETIKKIGNNFFWLLILYQFQLLHFLITISYSVGLEISPEKIFKL